MTRPLSREIRSQIENVVYTDIVYFQTGPWQYQSVRERVFRHNWQAAYFLKLRAMLRQPNPTALSYQAPFRKSRTVVGRVERKTAKCMEIREIPIILSHQDLDDGLDGFPDDDPYDSQDSYETSDEEPDEVHKGSDRESDEGSVQDSDNDSFETSVEGSDEESVEQPDECLVEGSDEAYYRELDGFSVGDLEEIPDSDEDL